jgi:ABC-type Na+ efflux pump permease subunit
LFSTAYIIRAIIEEKGSNIVELLMVSVKPLAVITGKIIAVMLYIFAFFMVLIASIVISWFISSSFLDTSGISSMINDIGISSAMSLGTESASVLLVSLLLAYLMIAIMGGISGSACSSMEDMESAQLSVVFIILVGYILSSLAPFFDSTPASVLFAIIPIISMFTAPISYVFGDISSGVLLLSWAFQTLIIIYLSLFCSRVYSELFIYKGNRIKFIELVSLSRRKKVDG